MMGLGWETIAAILLGLAAGYYIAKHYLMTGKAA